MSMKCNISKLVSGTPRRRAGFTLLELLVVLGIIAILITVLVPTVRGVREKAKETAVKQYCAALEESLANFASAHDGAYPGTAIDVMAPYPSHGLGDVALYSVGAIGQPIPGRMYPGVLGGTGTTNPGTESVYQKLKNVKDTPLNSSTTGTIRYFDSLIASNAIDEYPKNPFKSSGQGVANQMINIFRFEVIMPPASDLSNVNPYLLVHQNSSVNAPIQPDPIYTDYVRLVDDFDTYFGTDLLFASGDFAYVPILSTSVFPAVDNPQTLQNDAYRWGTLVSGYMLFGYGWTGSKVDLYEAERKEFSQTGLVGFGGAGVDTPYEEAVLALFNGAIYFSKKP